MITLDLRPTAADRFRMAHTDPEDEPRSIIQQKPPPPPARGPSPDGGGEASIIQQKPPPPPAREPQDESTPVEAPAQQAGAARVVEVHGPGSRRPQRRPPSGHVIIPARESDPEIISRAGSRQRMDSAPALLLIDYPRASIARATSPSSIGSASR